MQRGHVFVLQTCDNVEPNEYMQKEGIQQPDFIHVPFEIYRTFVHMWYVSGPTLNIRISYSIGFEIKQLNQSIIHDAWCMMHFQFHTQLWHIHTTIVAVYLLNWIAYCWYYRLVTTEYRLPSTDNKCHACPKFISQCFPIHCVQPLLLLLLLE